MVALRTPSKVVSKIGDIFHKHLTNDDELEIATVEPRCDLSSEKHIK